MPAHELVVHIIHAQALVAHGLAHVVEHGDVLQNHQVGVEDLPVAVIAAFVDAFLQRLDFLFRCRNGRVQTGQFRVYLALFDGPLRRFIEVILEHVGHGLDHA